MSCWDDVIGQYTHAWRGRPDPVRQFWLNDPRLLAVERRDTPCSAVILISRRA